jgi:hypothetical protein
VIGELGMAGVNVTGSDATQVYGIRQAQRNVCQSNEFQNTTLFVPTSQFAVANGSKYNKIFHYYGRADTYFHIGQALGNGMIQLLSKHINNVVQQP